MLSHLRVLDLTDGGASMAGRMLADLDHRRRTGVGQHIDLSQTECSIHFLGSTILGLDDDEITELIIAGAIE